MTRKRIYAVLFAILLFMSICTPFSAIAAEDVAKTQIFDSDTYYAFDSQTGTLTISGSGDVPDFTNSTGTSTSQPWALYRSAVLHVVVEEGITSLGRYCLYSVNKADIALPSTLISLGSYSMANTSSNTQVVLPEGFKTISANAFYGAGGLKSVYIPQSVTSIGASAFESCSSLESITFGHFNMQVTLGSKAFFKCSSLKTMTLPKRASLSSYSVGFKLASSGSVYDDFTMRVYRDSPAYNYAVSRAVNYELIGAGEIFEGDSVDCTYYTDNAADVMTFIFTPEVSAKYLFFSSGETDVSCELTQSDGSVINRSDDISEFDLNFKLICDLTAGQTYYFNVSGNNVTGVFAVNLMPYTISEISVESPDLTISADERVNGIFDVDKHLDGKSITVTYDTGYTDIITYSPGMTYMEYTPAYSDTQSTQKWKCGSNSGLMTIGGASQTIGVEILHSYTKTVYEPTYTQKGYTRYYCSLCGDLYYTDYVNSTGVRVSGRVVLMQSPDGSHEDNIPVANTRLYADGVHICTVERDGAFLFYTDADVKTITVYDEYGLTREIPLSPDSDNEMNLGDVAFFHFDYNADGYVNAKDFAHLTRAYGKYPSVETDDYLSRDYNQDGVIDDSDWYGLGAESFFTYGKITEEIY